MCEFRFSLYGLCFSRAFYHVASRRKRRKFAHRVPYSAERKRLLDEADARILSLTKRVSELQAIDEQLQELTPKYEQLLKDLEEATLTAYPYSPKSRI
jgi:hypothetical protein